MLAACKRCTYLTLRRYAGGLCEGCHQDEKAEQKQGHMPRQYSRVTVEENETGEQTTGNVLEYTPDKITLGTETRYPAGALRTEKRILTFDARRVHFVEERSGTE